MPVTVDVSRMIGGGYALRLQTAVTLSGPCMRCLEPAQREIEIEAREVDVVGSDDDDLSSPYVDDQRARRRGVGP